MSGTVFHAAVVEHLCISFTAITDFCVVPDTFSRQLSKAFKKAAIEDDGATKMATSGVNFNRLLRSSFDRIGMAKIVSKERRFHRESDSQGCLEHKYSVT